MCDNENNKSSNVFPVAILIVSAISFILGVITGVKATKLIMKHKTKCSCGDFDADEYVRSLNLDDDE